MKKLIALFSIVCFTSSFCSIHAKGFPNGLEIQNEEELMISNTDTIPDFESKTNKIKITGTIYNKDGVTPASNVVLYIYQTDEDGNYEMKKVNRKRHVYHTARIKTNADGQYTFYTFMPGKSLHSNELKNVHRVIQAPGKDKKEIDAFFFDDDPLLANLNDKCLSRMANSILKLEKSDDLYIAKKDIILNQDIY